MAHNVELWHDADAKALAKRYQVFDVRLRVVASFDPSQRRGEVWEQLRLYLLPDICVLIGKVTGSREMFDGVGTPNLQKSEACN
eukprot:COSAG04_NODE_5923_length_1455_cov_1.486726_2_plen_84_part_00